MDYKRVLITGSKEYGLCKEICNLFDTMDNIDYFTASRVNDWDLTSQTMQNKLAEVILWLLSQPEYVNINEISLDPIQVGIYARER
jgi:NADP-dependent 3-hydroxy acid dehydrogenase YdfG